VFPQESVARMLSIVLDEKKPLSLREKLVKALLNQCA
jgi:hypothetical protein